jgi:holliday junction DNA helicase RuvA
MSKMARETNMIAYLSGEVKELNNKNVIILTNGIGYKVFVTQSDMIKLRINSPAHLHIHTCVKQDAIELFGFIAQDTLETFELLIAVNGVGPKTALAILSNIESNDLKEAISSNNHKSLTKVSGIGPKTAQRIVLELKDKLSPRLSNTHSLIKSNVIDDLFSALQNLGYKEKQINKALAEMDKNILQIASFENLFKDALKKMG